MDNIFYHQANKGCQLVPAMKKVGTYRRRGKKNIRWLEFIICTIHGVDICRCGWQFNHHPINQN